MKDRNDYYFDGRYLCVENLRDQGGFQVGCPHTDVRLSQVQTEPLNLIVSFVRCLIFNPSTPVLPSTRYPLRFILFLHRLVFTTESFQKPKDHLKRSYDVMRTYVGERGTDFVDLSAQRCGALIF